MFAVRAWWAYGDREARFSIIGLRAASSDFPIHFGHLQLSALLTLTLPGI